MSALLEFLDWFWPDMGWEHHKQAIVLSKRLLQPRSPNTYPDLQIDPQLRAAWHSFTYCFWHGTRHLPAAPPPPGDPPAALYASAREWLTKLVGDRGFEAEGHIISSLQSWIQAMQPRLQEAFPNVDWSRWPDVAWPDVECACRTVEKRGAIKRQQEEDYAVRWPLRVTQGRPKFNHLKVEARDGFGVGIPPVKSPPALGFLAVSDVMCAFKQATQHWPSAQPASSTYLAQQDVVQSFVQNVLRETRGPLAPGIAHEKYRYLGFVACCVLGWNSALPHLSALVQSTAAWGAQRLVFPNTLPAVQGPGPLPGLPGSVPHPLSLGLPAGPGPVAGGLTLQEHLATRTRPSPFTAGGGNGTAHSSSNGIGLERSQSLLCQGVPSPQTLHIHQPQPGVPFLQSHGADPAAASPYGLYGMFGTPQPAVLEPPPAQQGLPFQLHTQPHQAMLDPIWNTLLDIAAAGDGGGAGSSLAPSGAGDAPPPLPQSVLLPQPLPLALPDATVPPSASASLPQPPPAPQLLQLPNCGGIESTRLIRLDHAGAYPLESGESTPVSDSDDRSAPVGSASTSGPLGDGAYAIESHPLAAAGPLAMADAEAAAAERGGPAAALPLARRSVGEDIATVGEAAMMGARRSVGADTSVGPSVGVTVSDTVGRQGSRRTRQDVAAADLGIQPAPGSLVERCSKRPNAQVSASDQSTSLAANGAEPDVAQKRSDQLLLPQQTDACMDLELDRGPPMSRGSVRVGTSEADEQEMDFRQARALRATLGRKLLRLLRGYVEPAPLSGGSGSDSAAATAEVHRRAEELLERGAPVDATEDAEEAAAVATTAAGAVASADAAPPDSGSGSGACSGTSGYTALHWACLRGDVALAELLIRHGADPDCRDAAGTPARLVNPAFTATVTEVTARCGTRECGPDPRPAANTFLWRHVALGPGEAGADVAGSPGTRSLLLAIKQEDGACCTYGRPIPYIQQQFKQLLELLGFKGEQLQVLMDGLGEAVRLRDGQQQHGVPHMGLVSGRGPSGQCLQPPRTEGVRGPLPHSSPPPAAPPPLRVCMRAVGSCSAAQLRNIILERYSQPGVAKRLAGATTGHGGGDGSYLASGWTLCVNYSAQQLALRRRPSGQQLLAAAWRECADRGDGSVPCYLDAVRLYIADGSGRVLRPFLVSDAATTTGAASSATVPTSVAASASAAVTLHDPQVLQDDRHKRLQPPSDCQHRHLQLQLQHEPPAVSSDADLVAGVRGSSTEALKGHLRELLRQADDVAGQLAASDPTAAPAVVLRLLRDTRVLYQCAALGAGRETGSRRDAGDAAAGGG
ncbi:hypothetical protein VOLCADRAFT_90280 [Volvox carteri f. nagariensis]|uniref:Uncharacterized protein n=1 Tax=Volvox carteri f. nagariensis TaxID=3068 RepID=D8TTY6_VOLCA|nr:uncharacterized protein VOLCADRAFT_90280 [Volvox carteri f. nagariensis]EFJ48948.1 hypothetical protein VOLCADRAFT_90280 [Volvox carteri f. nagariensis]|eukprot:XP_002949845.1 hypothetical protein VOLCADRAFT_90280 [Volvox carteri f. nagariensis]